MMTGEEKKSPILGSWRNVYLLVIGVLMLVILFIYLFSIHFR